MPKGPAARVTDIHTCPMQTPATPTPIPHGGGPVLGPGEPTVLIGGQPAAVVGDLAFCTPPAPPDSLVTGSATVLIGGRPAVRIGDTCAHGGVVSTGCETVIIGG